MRLVLSSIAAAAHCACSSGIDLKPVEPEQGEEPQEVALQPELPAVESGGAAGSGAATPGRSEVTEPSMLAQPGASGAGGAGADQSMNGAAGGDGNAAMGGSPALPA